MSDKFLWVGLCEEAELNGPPCGYGMDWLSTRQHGGASEDRMQPGRSMEGSWEATCREGGSMWGGRPEDWGPFSQSHGAPLPPPSPCCPTVHIQWTQAADYISVLSVSFLYAELSFS